MENQRLDFGEIVRKIADDKMLLPDFQRGFVWKDEDRSISSGKNADREYFTVEIKAG